MRAIPFENAAAFGSSVQIGLFSYARSGCMTYPSEAQEGKIRSRAESQIAMTPPEYLLEAHIMAAKPADRG